MKKLFFLLMLFAVLFTAQAQEQKVASKNKPSEDLENLLLADQLAKYGYKTYSATALIEAAKIMSSLKTHDLKFESYKQEPATKEQGTKKSKEGFDLASILGAAKKYADGDAKLLATITGLEKANQSTRGRVGGPGERIDVVPPNSTHTYDMNFIERELAEIAVRGDNDTDLDLYIYDSNNHLITQDTDYTDRCYVSWVPAWTGRYKVVIMNRGMVANRYTVLSN
ncbi:MAG: hypothetical protein WCL21_18855 [Mariniphaga sp.]